MGGYGCLPDNKDRPHVKQTHFHSDSTFASGIALSFFSMHSDSVCLVSRDCEGEDLSQSTPRHIKVFKIAKEVNAADSLACFSATNILRDHVRLVNCELIDNQEHVFVGVSFHLQHQQGQLWASKTARLREGRVLQRVEMLLA